MQTSDMQTSDRAQSSAISRRGALKLGLGSMVAVAAFGPGAQIVMAAEGQVLKVINPAFSQDWSPLRGGGVPFRWNSIWNASAMYFDEKGEIQPYVMTEWTPSADFTSWTFKLSPDCEILRRQRHHGRGRQGLVGAVVDARHQEPAHRSGAGGCRRL